MSSAGRLFGGRFPPDDEGQLLGSKLKDLMRYFYWDLASPVGRYLYVSKILRNIPGDFGNYARGLWYTRHFKKAGRNLRVLEGAVILNPQNIECGDDVTIGIGNYIQAGGGLTIRSNALFGPYVKIWTQNHRFESYETPVRQQGYDFAAVEIGDDVWIGADTFVMPGTRIGDKCIVAACSVLGGKEYPSAMILAGNPARKIGTRESQPGGSGKAEVLRRDG